MIQDIKSIMINSSNSLLLHQQKVKNTLKLSLLNPKNTQQKWLQFSLNSQSLTHSHKAYNYHTMENENPDKQQNQSEAKRIRRNQSKSDKDTPRYECFCAKQYLSYPALYLHIKNKHSHSFQNPRNGKKIEMTKLIQTFDANEGYKIYKISIDSLATERQKQEAGIPNVRYFESQGYPDNSIFFSSHHFKPYSNMPFQFQYQYMGNKDQSAPLPKQLIIEIAFTNYIKSLNISSAKQKTQTQLLLGLFIKYINDNYPILKDYGEQIQCRRYTAEQNCKHLSIFMQEFQNKWIPEAAQQENSYYTFFMKHSDIIVRGKYKKVLQQLLLFVNGQSHQDIVQPEINRSNQSYNQYKTNTARMQVQNNEIKGKQPSSGQK